MPGAWQVLAAETARLGRLTDDLRTVSRAEERQLDLRLTRSDPREFLQAAAAAAGAAYADKGVRLLVRPGDPLRAVVADPDRIGEVLGNLLSNALRHTPAGGAVELSAVRAGSDAVDLAVVDSGEGIPPESLPRVFERFYRADSARSRDQGGSGIGLTIAEAIAQAHGGSLRAESDGPGRGATFTLRLPTA